MIEPELKDAMDSYVKEFMHPPGTPGIFSVGIGKENGEYVLRVAASSWKRSRLPKEWKGLPVHYRNGSQGYVLTCVPKWPDDFRGFGSNVTPRKQR